MFVNSFLTLDIKYHIFYIKLRNILKVDETENSNLYSTMKLGIYFTNFFFIASVTMLIVITIANKPYSKAISFQEEIHSIFQKTTHIIANTTTAITISLIRFFIRTTSFVKPANKKQALFPKPFLLKMSITNKPAFFIWFNKTYLPLFLLVHFHYSCIVYS